MQPNKSPYSIVRNCLLMVTFASKTKKVCAIIITTNTQIIFHQGINLYVCHCMSLEDIAMVNR